MSRSRRFDPNPGAVAFSGAEAGSTESTRCLQGLCKHVRFRHFTQHALLFHAQCLLLVGGTAFTDAQLRISAFNIRVFGVSKMEDQEVVDTILQVRRVSSS